MIHISLSPNLEKDDVLAAVTRLVVFWTWKRRVFQDALEHSFLDYFNNERVYLFNSGRSALYAYLKSLQLKNTDEIITQAFTCNAVANPIIWAGARPVYVDADESFNIDIGELKNAITKNTKAIIIQNTFGIPAKINEIKDVAKENNLIIIEDCAHALGAKYNGKKIGTLGDVAIFSFGRDKIISSVYGGALMINNDFYKNDFEEIYRNIEYPGSFWTLQQLLHPLITFVALGTYRWLGKYVMFGSQKLKFLSLAVSAEERIGKRPSHFPEKLPDPLAYLAFRQFDKLKKFNNHRKKLAKIYEESLKNSDYSIVENYDPDSIFLRYPVKHKNAQNIIESAKMRGIILGDWYKETIAPEGTDQKKLRYKKTSCPQAEKFADQIINLPTNIKTTVDDAKEIIKMLKYYGIYEIREMDSKDIWDKFITKQKDHTFLQSWAWGDVNKSLGEKIWRLGLYKKDKIIAATSVIKVHAKKGNFIFIPHGPVIKTGELKNRDKILSAFTDEFLKLAKKEEVNFVRISPLLERNSANRNLFKALGYSKAPIYMHAENSWKMNLENSEDEIMADMRKNTRNLIRRAKKDGVEIISGDSDYMIEEFLKLYKTTAKKHGFVPFSDRYIKEEVASFGGNAKIYIAKWNDTVLSSALIVFYGNSAFYHHGANSIEHVKVPTAYLLQWQAILDAKNSGKQFYNFWGIAEDENDKKHPWYGLTFFKKGFGGFREDYIHTQDYPLNIKYWISYILEKIILLKRRV